MAEKIAQQIRNIQKTVHELDIRQSDNDLEVTNQYGYLKFDDNKLDSTTRLSQYIRLALQTNAKTVVEFMQYGWGLPTPDLIISVIGGGKQFNMSAHLRKTFQRGLVTAAATTNAWLITDGTNAGVVKEVGEALNNYRYKDRKHALDFPCIGIGSWGYTAGTEQLDTATMAPDMSTDDALIRTTVSSKYCCHRRIETVEMDVADEYYVRSYVVKWPERDRCDLESNHTHFLLFDDGSSSANNVLVQRAEIEKYSRRVNVATITTDALTPIVMVLVEGGPLSIRAVCQALESNIPLVVVQESGRAADLVADLHTFFCKVEIDGSRNLQRPRAGFVNKKDDPLDRSRETELNLILERARADNNAWVDEVKDELCRVLRLRKQLVTIFKFDSERHHGNLEDAILEGLFNDAKFSGDNNNEQQCLVAELKLAMAWKKFDYAHKHILTDTTISKWKEIDLCRALVEALGRGHVDFVDLLIEYGTSPEKLTIHDLEQLYATADTDSGLPVQKKNKKNCPTRHDYYSTYFKKQCYLNEISSDKSSPLGKNSTRELFLWAIFLDRFDLGKYLCSKTWNQSVAPLIAARIYRLAAILALHSETKRHYENNASQFDTYAMSIIDRCFDNDECFAVDLLQQPAVAFGRVDPLKLAKEANCRSFLASKCVQTYLDHIWFGKIDYKQRSIPFRIFLCVLFLPLLPFFFFVLPYVHKHKQLVSSTKYGSRSRNPAMNHTKIISDRDVVHDRIRWSKKFIYFYRAPIVRFYYNVIFYVLFLGLFSFVLLVNYFPWNVHGENRSSINYLPLPITEIILHVCTCSLILEELRQFYLMERGEYFGDMWNWIDVIAIVLYLVGFVTRFFVIETLFTISKIVLCLDLIIWFVGTLHLFAAFEHLGPKLVMIFNTMKDLLFFICFILIFLCGFSITSWSLITSISQVHWNYTNDGQLLNVTLVGGGSGLWTWRLLRDITNYGVWKVFGQVDNIEGTDSYSNVAFVLAIIFVAISNVLLLNVLIALFNVTIQNVQEQSHDLWRYQRFLIVNEYSKKTPLPPPFNMIYYLFSAARLLVARVRLYQNRHQNIVNDTLLDNLETIGNTIQQQFKISDAMRRESAIADDYWRYLFKHEKKDRTEAALQNIEQKIDHLTLRLPNDNKLTLTNDHPDRQINSESDV